MLNQLYGKMLTEKQFSMLKAYYDFDCSLAEIADERFRELALEGHRWYDLRRTTRPRIVKEYMDADFMPQQLIIEENDTRYVIPLPKEATEGNPNLKGAL